MFQRPSVNQVSSVADVWQGTPPAGWWDTARRILALPSTLRGFTVFLIALMLISAATAMQVYLSAQILESKYEISTLRAELDTVERSNADIAWQIAMLTRLENVAAKARVLGFEPVVSETYVTRSTVTRTSGAPAAETRIDTKAPPQLFYADIPSEATAPVQSTQTSAETVSTFGTFGANVETGISRFLDRGTKGWTSAVENVKEWMGRE